ncbi:metal ABC transporter substrate-binding protein [Paenibacillus monticola]|uniref:Zinc ABC transporter substrate-binding protein n=1 Tax=Paenibacillus monticola TaxID=2666075 RepID=A0A7X2H3J2_9BACL|nr:metal ABC transporter substrate-binding protein [Paenibacillus monticola]MRN52850.1 zinc ABC transporter substrate-binding protein [Paenibacillus monticola]
MKLRIRHLAILSLSSLLIAAGCGNNNNNATTNASNATNAPAATTEVPLAPVAEKLNIKVSFYPMYEFTKNVAGDLADVEAMIPAGIEPHDWEPTAQDMAKITAADILVYNGAGMEGWVDQVLDSASDSKLVAVEASKGLQIIDGFEEEEEAPAETSNANAKADEHEHSGLDPHVWLDPALAIQEVRIIEGALSAAAPENAEAFTANADTYVAKLEQLNQEFKDGLRDTKRKDFITQHAAFGYLAKEYGLTQVPIAGLSPEQEPSAAKMAEIVDFAKAHDVKTIFFETLVSSSVADTIAKEIGAKSAVLNPIEGLTDEDRSNNLDYLGIMRLNLEALKLALNE